MQKMDDKNSSVISENVGMENIASSRDENKSPTSGSSSDALGDDGLNRKESNRKQRRRQSKVKRKWKPYTDLSWDERKKQDDRESRRAFAKRERLSAEGHPIAPYNTTQFLMDDHKPSANQGGKEESATLRKLAPTDSSTSLQSLDTGTSSIMNTEGTFVMEHKRARFYANSPHPSELGTQGEGGAECRDDIQRYILNDFSQTYAGIHAEELQSMSQMDLIAECLKLEKRVSMSHGSPKLSQTTVFTKSF